MLLVLRLYYRAGIESYNPQGLALYKPSQGCALQNTVYIYHLALLDNILVFSLYASHRLLDYGGITHRAPIARNIARRDIRSYARLSISSAPLYIQLDDLLSIFQNTLLYEHFTLLAIRGRHLIACAALFRGFAFVL